MTTTTTTSFLGMRGTGDWSTDQRPKNWREGILYLYPNGSAPLTAILSKMKSEKVDDPEFYWWTKTLPTQRAALTGKYTNSLLSSAYASGGVAGDTIFAKMAEADAEQFRAGHQVSFAYSSDYSMRCVGKVTDVVKNGSSSYVSVKLLEADDNSASYDISDADVLYIIGNINAEGAGMPDAISYNPTKLYNYTQIFRTPLEITRTAMQTKLRTGDAYKEMKREALELHSIEMEKAFFWSVKTEGTGSNAKPERTTDGIVPVILANASANCSDYRTNSTYSGKTWLQGGEEWLDSYCELIFRYGSRNKLAFCGSGALLGINRVAKANGTFMITPQTKSYGIQVVDWVTPFGTISLLTHPLFSYEAVNRNSMVIFDPKDITFRFIQDTEFFKDNPKTNTGYTRRDGIAEEFLTEAGLEYHHPIGWGYLNGVGQDNAV